MTGGDISPLMWACIHGHTDIVTKLLQSGKCDVTLKSKNTSHTAWSATFSTSIAAMRDQSDIAQLLIDTGKIDVNAPDESDSVGGCYSYSFTVTSPTPYPNPYPSPLPQPQPLIPYFFHSFPLSLYRCYDRVEALPCITAQATTRSIK